MTELSDEALHHQLKDDNDARTEAILKRTNGQVNPVLAAAGLRMEVYMKHILLDLGVLDRADLDFEGKRTEQLDAIEAQVEAMEKAMREAQIRCAAEWHRNDLMAVTALAESGAFSLEGLITHREEAQHAAGAYVTAFGDSACLKMVLDWRHTA